MEPGKKLRMITYLSPGIPLQLYQLYQQYLEEVLQCSSYLMVESRWSGPPADRGNPFDDDEVDIGFLSSTWYLQQTEIQKNKFIGLLPAAPIHIHEKSTLRPVYFSEIIINKDRKDLIKTFHDLNGHRWAYCNEGSLSGNAAVLAELKKNGLNSSFFGDIIPSGSHHNSISMVCDRTADAAAVDSNVLIHYYKDHPDVKDQLHTLMSLGPLPIQPVVINSRLPALLQEQLKKALLEMNSIEKWRNELEQYSVWGFKSIDHSLYNAEKEIMEVVKDQKLHNAYY